LHEIGEVLSRFKPQTSQMRIYFNIPPRMTRVIGLEEQKTIPFISHDKIPLKPECHTVFKT